MLNAVARIRRSARQGLFAIAVAVYVLALAAALFALPGSGLAASKPGAPLVLESYPEGQAEQGAAHGAQGAAAAEAPAAAGPDQNPAQAAAQAPSAQGAQSAPIRLFGTVEFRSPIKNLPKWERVRDSEIRRPTFLPGGGLDLDTRNPGVEQRWATLRGRLKNAPLQEQVREVHRFFNQWPYKTDMELWGVEDIWNTPREFIERSGDCEDYAIAKYYALRDLGVPANLMRIAAVMDTIRNLGHAVLIVYMDGDAYVLDNLTNLVLSHRRLTHYTPQYTVNEEFLWRHVVPKTPAPK